MKTLTFTLVAAFLFSCNSTQKITETATSESSTLAENTGTPKSSTAIPPAHGIEFFKNYMNESYTNLENAVKGLTPEQLAYKPSEDRWSIAQCLEHIVLTEPHLYEYQKAAMSQPANPEKRSEIKFTDDQVMTMMLDRNHKAQAPAEAVPHGKYTDYQTALNDLQAQRKTLLKELGNPSISDLRNHVLDSPMGSIDAYQFLLFIPGHTMRHTLQIQEVKASPGFPKN